MRTVDLLNSIFIIIVFILLYVSNILAIGKKNIENNWAVYRCSPMVMPFASMFGHDTMQNFAYCIQNMQTNFMAPMLAPSNYSNVLAVSGVSSAIDGQTGSLGLLSNRIYDGRNSRYSPVYLECLTRSVVERSWMKMEFSSIINCYIL